MYFSRQFQDKFNLFFGILCRRFSEYCIVFICGYYWWNSFMIIQYWILFGRECVLSFDDIGFVFFNLFLDYLLNIQCDCNIWMLIKKDCYVVDVCYFYLVFNVYEMFVSLVDVGDLCRDVLFKNCVIVIILIGSRILQWFLKFF